MANVFADLLKKGAAQGIIPSKVATSKNWFRNQAQQITTASTQTVTRNTGTVRSRMEMGNMYFFRYDAKTQKDLPYWDSFPLIFPVDTTKDGFYGINFHYLPYVHRARFMDALYTLVEDKNLTENSKMNLTYNLIKGISKAPYYKTCLKLYLNRQVRSNFYYISPTQWDIALFLPVEQFQKANRNKVFAETIKALNG